MNNVTQIVVSDWFLYLVSTLVIFNTISSIVVRYFVIKIKERKFYTKGYNDASNYAVENIEELVKEVFEREKINGNSN